MVKLRTARKLPRVAKRGQVPLARALSKLGLATRSEARALIGEGRVRVDGLVVDDPLALVTPERIRVQIDGQGAEPREFIAIALHKPRGVVTTRRDPEGRKTVYDLLADLAAHVVPAGRLDVATSGLILLTNDTRFADWLTDPRNAVPRVYLVTVRGRVSDEQALQLERGVRSRGELLSARSVIVRKSSGRESHLVVELVEGKNREVRRLLTAIGHEVTQLRRVQFGGLTIEGLAPGEWRLLDAAELARSFPGAAFSGNKLRTHKGDR